MRKNVSIEWTAAACLIVGCFFPVTAAAQVRVAPPEVSVSAPAATPATPFDPRPALAALMPGTATILGKACAYVEGGQVLAKHRPVHLLPMSTHLEEWLELRKNPKRHVAPLAREVTTARYEAVTDRNGRFTFTNLQPGRYYIYVPFAFDEIKTANAYTGTGYNAYGGRTDYYQRESHLVGHNTFLERIVEIEREGQSVKAPIRNGSVWKTRAFLSPPCNP